MELHYPEVKNKELVNENIYFEMIIGFCLAIARALIRNPKILLLDEGKLFPFLIIKFSMLIYSYKCT